MFGEAGAPAILESSLSDFLRVLQKHSIYACGDGRLATRLDGSFLHPTSCTHPHLASPLARSPTSSRCGFCFNLSLWRPRVGELDSVRFAGAGALLQKG